MKEEKERKKESLNVGMKGWLSYLLRAQVVPIIPSAKANPNPRTIPYPNPWDNGGDDIADTFFIPLGLTSEFANEEWRERLSGTGLVVDI